VVLTAQDEHASSVCGDSFEVKTRLLESVLAPTMLHKQAKHAAQSLLYTTYVSLHSLEL